MFLPSGNQACCDLIHYQVKAFALRTWEVNKGQVLDVPSAYL